MLPGSQPRPRGWSLTLRLSVALLAGAFFVSLLLGFLGADREDRHTASLDAAREQSLAGALADRAAPLLERQDLMRLSVLAAVARDQTEARVLVLDRNGRVVLDTALVSGDRQMGLLASSGPFQRRQDRGEGMVVRESVAPVRFGGELIGEVRLQREVGAITSSFDTAWFGLVFLCCLSLVAVAAMMGYHWTARVRTATDALFRISAGEVAGVGGEPAEGELQDLGLALREMERGVQDGLQRVTEGYVAMASRVVESLERGRLVPPGHAERTAQYAVRLADRIRLLPADRSELELACRLADLGKLAVRPSILLKQGPLTDVESQSLAHHPVHAAEQLECVPSLRRVARIVKHQLERYDGTGAPDSLRGDRIPIGSRILAIASAFDLLLTCASDRPRDWEQAVAELEAAAGTVLDPWLVEVFAQDVREAPPDVPADRPVMIVPADSLSWRTAVGRATGGEDDPEETDLVCEDLEVMTDERQSEDAP